MADRRPSWDVAARRALSFTSTLQEMIRIRGHIDVPQIVGNPTVLGALAELEMVGAIEFTGPPGPDWKIPCRVVPEAERKAVREKRAICETREWASMPLASRKN